MQKLMKIIGKHSIKIMVMFRSEYTRYQDAQYADTAHRGVTI